MGCMEKDDLVQRVCAANCAFYRPGKDEALSCKGFSVVRRLIAEGRDIGADGNAAVPGAETENALFQSLCRSCPFFEHDCDFAAWKRGEAPLLLRKDVNPCGGFLFLGCTIDRGGMDIKEINQVI